MAVTGAVMVPHPPIIVPEIGRGEERKIQATIDSYRRAAERIAQWKPDTVVVISPHAVMYADYFHISPGPGAKGDFGQFRAPQVKFRVDYDTEFVGLLSQEAQARDIPAGTLGERDRITGWCASGCRGCLFRNTMNWGSAYRRQQKFSEEIPW